MGAEVRVENHFQRQPIEFNVDDYQFTHIIDNHHVATKLNDYFVAFDVNNHLFTNIPDGTHLLGR